MKHICAWCKRDLPEDEEEPRDKVSHGICRECAKEVFGVDKEPTRQERR